MVASTQRVADPLPEGLADWGQPHSPEAPLAYTAAYAAQDHPLCRLVARTRAGAQHCARGCTQGAVPTAGTHVCPFGLTLWRDAAGEWTGRRFATVQRMHQTMDWLLGEGIDEETILAHLPPNPIVNEGELHQVLRGPAPLSPATAQRTPGGRAGAASRSAIEEFAAPALSLQISNLLEFLEQVNQLIATAPRLETICERFLRVVSGIVPSKEMVLYLFEPAANDWVLAGAVENAEAERREPLVQSCRLAPGGVGARAIAQHKLLIERSGKIEPFGGELHGAGTLAIPFPLTSSQVQGVWLVHQSQADAAQPLVVDQVRLMRLLAEFLAARLRQASDAVPATAAAPAATVPTPGPAADGSAEAAAEPACPVWTTEQCLAALRPPLARACRQQQAVSMLYFDVALGPGASAEAAAMPLEELSRLFAAAIRPYDLIGRIAGEAHAWAVILDDAGEEVARTVAARLLTLFEDLMDSRGGTEELGLHPAIGISVWGADATSAPQMIEHARTAARQAQAVAANHEIIRLSPEGTPLRAMV